MYFTVIIADFVSYSFIIRSIATIEFTSIVLDGETPSMDPNICYKRREYLVITEHDDAFSLNTAYTNIMEGEKLMHEDEITRKQKRWVYCGNWNKVDTKNHKEFDAYSNSKLKKLHVVGTSKPILNNSSVGFIIVYVVRSAMPPLINDGNRHQQQQHGFKLKVSHAKNLPTKT